MPTLLRSPPPNITPTRLLPIPAALPWVQRLNIRLLPERISLAPTRRPDLSAFQWPLIWAASIILAAAFICFHLVPASLGHLQLVLRLGIPAAAGALWVAAWLIRAAIIARRQVRAGPFLISHNRPDARGPIAFPRWRLTLERERIIAFQILRGSVADSSNRRQWVMAVEQLTLVYVDDGGQPIRRFICMTQPGFRPEVAAWLQSLVGVAVHWCEVAGPPALFRDLRRHKPPDDFVFAEPAETPAAAVAAGHTRRSLVCPACGYPVHDLPGGRCPECGAALA